MHLDANAIIAVIATWGYVVIFPLSVIEGPVVAVIGGFLVSLGTLNWFLLYIILMLGDIVGDALYYALGRYGHGPIGQHIARWIGITPHRFNALSRAFHKYDTRILLWNKAQALGSVVLYFAGAARMSFWRYMVVNTLGSAPKIALFQVIGYYFGRSFVQIQTYLDYAALASLILPVVLLVLYYALRWYARSKELENDLT